MARVSGSVESGRLVHVDESQIRGHVDEVVRACVEETPANGCDPFRDQVRKINPKRRHPNAGVRFPSFQR